MGCMYCCRSGRIVRYGAEYTICELYIQGVRVRTCTAAVMHIVLWAYRGV